MYSSKPTRPVTWRRTAFITSGTFGFTLIEVIVTIVLVSVAVVGVFTGIRSLSAADFRAREADLLQRLASHKLDEMNAVADPNTEADSGDFTDQGYPDVTWTMTVETTNSTYADQVTITATRKNASQSLTGVVFVRPATTGGTQ